MIIRNSKHIVLLILVILATGCQKVVDLKLDSAAGQIVIEANLTNIRTTQFVTISQSVSFTSTNDFPPVSGATVVMTDGKGSTFKFTESPTTPGTYTIASTAGKAGSTYTLTVQVSGKTYTAVSTMPQPVGFAPLSVTNDVFNKGSKSIVTHFNDPANIANNYRFVLYVNGGQIKNIYTVDDTFTDGGAVDINLYQSDITIKTGDKIVVEDQGIDRNVFYYWFSLSQQQGDGAGNGAAPSNPPTNIVGGALGYFSAHTSIIQTLIVPQ